jgi:hypothetical protein
VRPIATLFVSITYTLAVITGINYTLQCISDAKGKELLIKFNNLVQDTQSDIDILADMFTNPSSENYENYNVRDLKDLKLHMQNLYAKILSILSEIADIHRDALSYSVKNQDIYNLLKSYGEKIGPYQDVLFDNIREINNIIDKKKKSVYKEEEEEEEEETTEGQQYTVEGQVVPVPGGKKNTRHNRKRRVSRKKRHTPRKKRHTRSRK